VPHVGDPVDHIDVHAVALAVEVEMPDHLHVPGI
jgi:hypothetical protein